MTFFKLIPRSLVFYWRTHLGVVLGAAVATAVLVGALAVGDSVRYSLRMLATTRLGKVQLAMTTRNRFFREQLAPDLQEQLSAEVAGVLLLRGIAARSDGAARANNVQIVGVGEQFWSLGAADDPLRGKNDAVVLNQRLASQLGIGAGDQILLRLERPSLLPREAPLSISADNSVAMRVDVSAITTPEEFGNFSVDVNQIPPYNVFVPLDILQRLVGLPGRVNTLLVGGKSNGELRLGDADSAFKRCWELTDAGIELRELPRQRVIELTTPRIFLDPPVAQAAKDAAPGAYGVLTYFVNELRVGDRAAPYSMVASLGPLGALPGAAPTTPPIPTEMTDGEAVINEWLAGDLHARVGQQLEMTYFVLGPMRKLIERTSRFRIRAVVPIRGAAADRELTPRYPGLAETSNCRDWDPGIPINLDRIRDKDEEYWDAHRGTPKGFITLREGQKIWGNRFGELTAIRFPLAEGAKQRIAASILKELDPASIGLFFRPVRDLGMAGAGEGLDFGGLFLGFSVFLIVSALLLMALLFVFGVEQRGEEIGVLTAIGFRPRTIRRLMLEEGAVLVLLGAVVGGSAGLLYTRGMIYGLRTIWGGAVTYFALRFHAEWRTLAMGVACGVMAALIAMWGVLRGKGKRSVRELLAGEGGKADVPGPGAIRRWAALGVGAFAVIGATAVIALTGAGRGKASVVGFFSAGTLLLVAGLAFSTYLLGAIQRTRTSPRMTMLGLALRNTARRRGRSLAVIALLGCGSFLIVAIGANRHDPGMDADRVSSGTGGFALYGKASVPIYGDLNTPAGGDAFGLKGSDLRGARILGLRLREGDDASCLNLNRAQTPQLLGVRPEEMQARNAFTFINTIERRDPKHPWLLLNRDEGKDAVPAIGDEATVIWGLGKKVGDTLTYTDGRGRSLHLRIVGVIANSILQGSLLISQSNFERCFPSEAGFRVFLIDAPPADMRSVSAALTRALQDVGLELTAARDRLAAFNMVENTYLSIFQVLGGFGMILGSIAMGIVVLRNIMERRSELALLRAVGFTKWSVQRLTFLEHCGLLLLGLFFGTAAAVLAVLPAIRSPGSEIPYASLSLTLGGVVVSGMLWVFLASVLGLRGPLLSALRNE